MDDDGLSREQIDILAALPVSVDKNGHRTVVVPSHLFDRLIATATALESRSEVLEAIQGLMLRCIRTPDGQYAYSRCNVCGHPFWDREEHRGDCPVPRWRESLRDFVTPRAEPGAPERVAQEARRHSIEPASAAPKLRKLIEDAPKGDFYTGEPAAAPDAPEAYSRDYAQGRARGFAEGLEEAAKVCEQIDELTMFIGRPISTEAEFHTMVRELFFLKARAIRAKIKPTRGET